jgi:hypothetical protein
MILNLSVSGIDALKNKVYVPVGNHAHRPTWPLSDPPTHTPVVWSPEKKIKNKNEIMCHDAILIVKQD